MTGVKTNIVTAAEVTATESADSPQLPDLLAKTAQTFDSIREVSADKAYSSKRNLRAIGTSRESLYRGAAMRIELPIHIKEGRSGVEIRASDIEITAHGFDEMDAMRSLEASALAWCHGLAAYGQLDTAVRKRGLRTNPNASDEVEVVLVRE